MSDCDCMLRTVGAAGESGEGVSSGWRWGESGGRVLASEVVATTMDEVCGVLIVLNLCNGLSPRSHD
jgi:hypothetical protein